jgi:hypothetical protein
MAPETTTADSVAQSPAPAKTSARKGAHKKRVSKKRAAKKRTSKKPVAARKSVAKKPAPRKHRTKKQLTTKAQAIRDAAKEIGGKPRPKDIIAALATKQIAVSSPQVISVLKAAGLYRRRRRRKVMAVVAATLQQSLNINELVQVKKLADQLGGAARLKELAAALERLM